MDSCALERERIDACVFKVMTADGPVSMCLHNAKRDGFILQPIGIHTPGGKEYWQPLTGQTTLNPEASGDVEPAQHGLKRLKGLARQRLLVLRRARTMRPARRPEYQVKS